jgi:hypothetical protein
MNENTLRAPEAAMNKYRVESVYKALRLLRFSFSKTDELPNKDHGVTEGVSLMVAGDTACMRLTFVKDNTFACWDDYLMKAEDLEPLIKKVLGILTGP